MSESSSNSSSDSSSTISARKLRANRRNAQKSTGPRTEEGKKASSRNSLVHGLYCAKDFILPGESKAQFLFLRQNHIRSLLPMTSIELSLVERVARNDWKIKRVEQLQHQWHLLQMGREKLQAEVLAEKVDHPVKLLTQEDCDSMTRFEKDYLERLYEASDEDRDVRLPRRASEKILAESIGRGFVTQEHIRSIQFAGDEPSLNRFERLEKMELRYENAMDKAMRQLERLQTARRKRLKPDEIDEDELTCPYLEEYPEIQAVLEEEQAKEQAFVKEIGEAEENVANEATEDEAEFKSNGGKDLATDEEPLAADEMQEDESDDRDMDFQSMPEASERTRNRGFDGPSTD